MDLDDRNRLSDEEVVLQLREGDREAFRQLHGRYCHAVTRYLAAGCGCLSDAEDLCQEVFVRVFRFADHFHEELEFRPWLFTIAGNELRRFLKKRAKRRTESFPADPADPARPAEAFDRREAIGRALDRLPDPQREVVTMKEYGGLTFAEIGLVMNDSENTVKTRMYAGLTKLRGHLKEYAVDG